MNARRYGTLIRRFNRFISIVVATSQLLNRSTYTRLWLNSRCYAAVIACLIPRSTRSDHRLVNALAFLLLYWTARSRVHVGESISAIFLFPMYLLRRVHAKFQLNTATCYRLTFLLLTSFDFWAFVYIERCVINPLPVLNDLLSVPEWWPWVHQLRRILPVAWCRRSETTASAYLESWPLFAFTLYDAIRAPTTV